ncbi:MULTISPECIES: universal stress protein [unclassified Streptomyces]|uniref:universal stress protein n=1 Tax=unclassified Streptomyces TaxID=2593676 RepID=UPI002271E152|nr:MULTISPECIES: universal stress protein [unclassified Streptomyces]MCY0922514.1 universal stress protein [Streptomyces sp. H27-G5]MCY0962173.1 universal stress protein [Streptomyces sp. H27-H5]
MEGSTTHRPDLGSVVVGVDGSSTALSAALWAAAEASRRDSTLHIFYAGDTADRTFYLSAEIIERVRAEGRDLLEVTATTVSERFPALHVTREYSRRDPVSGLHRVGAKYGATVVGHRGMGGFESLRLGSVGLRIAAAATTPVIVVRGSEDLAENGVVLAGVRDEYDFECARYAAREAELRKATLRLLTVWNILQYAGTAVTMLDDVDEFAGRHIRSLKSVADRVREEFPALTVNTDAEKSVSVASVLVEASRHADLLVMGGRRSPGYFGPTLGRTTHSLLHHSHCPVELIPRHDEEQGGDAS